MLSHLLQPCPLSSPCCWPASTAAATPGSICASQGICSRILGRIFCAVLLTTSNHPSAAVSMNLTQVTRASPQTLQLRALAVKRASHRPRQHKYRPSLSLFQAAHSALRDMLSPIKHLAVQQVQIFLTGARRVKHQKS